MPLHYNIVKTFDNYFNANIILTKLQAAGIECYLQDEFTVTIDPILSNAIGGIKLVVKKEDGAETLRLPIVVGTPTAGAKVSQKEITLTKDGVQVKMNATNGFIAGKENEVSFAISQNGKIITPENYLGAKGHVVALGDDPNTFIHGHPSEDGHTEVDFAFAFEKEGTYTLFAQFKVDGVIRTYPFTITVTKGSGTASMPTDESQPHSH